MNFLFFKKAAHRSRGFSLVEVLVSVSIFAIVVTMSVGTLIVLIDANGKAQNTQAVVNNVAFILDSMVRDIRTGYFYHCANNHPDLFFENDYDKVSDCKDGADSFVFTESGTSLTGVLGGRIGFRYAEVDGRGVIERRVGEDGTWQVMTSPDVVIDTFEFVVTGTGSNNDVSPLVTIFIAGSAGNVVGTDSSFSLQTTVTQQTLDL